MKPEKELYQIRDILFRLAVRILGNTQDAEDAFSDFYLHVREKSHVFKNYENLRGALVQSMRNHCLNYLKALEKQRSTKGLDQEIEQPLADNKALLEKYAIVQKIIENLPEKQGTLIHLRMVEGFSMKEIAEILDEKVNTVEVSISRIRKKIRKSYEDRARRN